MRTYKRKTTRGTTSTEVYELDALEIIEKKKNYRDVAKEFDLCHVSLYNFVKKKKTGTTFEMGYKKTRLVFNSEQETIITEYLLKCANIYFGLLPTDVKKLAYQCAMFYNIEKVPESWKTKEMAGNIMAAKKSAILTDTLEKNSLEEEHNSRDMKKRKMTTKNLNKENKKDKGKGKGKAKGNINKDEIIEKNNQFKTD